MSDEPKKIVALNDRRREPNKEVIETFETLLELAKRGEIREIAYAYTCVREDGTPANRFGDVVTSVGGAINLVFFLRELEEIFASVFERTSLPRLRTSLTTTKTPKMRTDFMRAFFSLFLLSFLSSCVSSHPRPRNYEPPNLDEPERQEPEPPREVVVIVVVEEVEERDSAPVEELRRLKR